MLTNLRVAQVCQHQLSVNIPVSLHLLHLPLMMEEAFYQKEGGKSIDNSFATILPYHMRRED